MLGLVLCMAGTGCARNAGQVTQSPSPVKTASPTPTVNESPSPPAAPVALEGPVNVKAVSDLTGAGPAVAIEMQMTDFAFDPTFVKVTPGANVRLALKNAGTLADHTFTIDSLGIDRQLRPAEQAEVVIQLPTSGAFRFYCRLHVDRGMQGAIFFNPGDAVTATALTPVPPGGGSRTGTRTTTRSSTTRRSTGTAASRTPPRTNAPEPDDLEIPDLEINEPDEDGNVRSADGPDGVPGSKGAPGVPGGKGQEVEVP